MTVFGMSVLECVVVAALLVLTVVQLVYRLWRRQDLRRRRGDDRSWWEE